LRNGEKMVQKAGSRGLGRGNQLVIDLQTPTPQNPYTNTQNPKPQVVGRETVQIIHAQRLGGGALAAAHTPL